jgi:putative glutamine amidotransferase
MPTPLAQGEAAAILEPFDAMLLLGGGDIDPSRYGQDRHPEVAGVSELRDEFELALVRATVDAALPVLAVCRGIQVLNVALGGTLHQHLDGSTGVVHRGTDDPWSTHIVRLEEGSLVAEAMGGTEVECSASHHQAIDRLGRGVRPVGWAGDDIVEAVQLEDGWVVGVQWHPERTAERDPAQQRLFDALVERARLRPAGRRA